MRLTTIGFVAFLSVASSIANAGPNDPSIETTALRFLLTERPYANLQDPGTKTHLEQLATNVRRVFKKVLTSTGLRLSRTYIFNVGWGDCESGCTFNHRKYFEVYESSNQIEVEIIATTGAQMDPVQEAA